jgi:Holliday junction resolvasome RuvABC DNA-binding subunit
MVTAKQRKLAKAIIENLEAEQPKTGAELLEVAGYKEGTQIGSPGRTIEQKGVQEALEEYGFNEDNAKRVVGEIMLDPSQKGDTRINAAKEVFKVRGSYAPEKHLNVNVDVTSEARVKSKEAISQFLNNGQ